MPVVATAFRSCVSPTTAVFKTWIVQCVSTASVQPIEFPAVVWKNASSTTGFSEWVVTDASAAEFAVRDYLVSTTGLKGS